MVGDVHSQLTLRRGPNGLESLHVSWCVWVINVVSTLRGSFPCQPYEDFLLGIGESRAESDFPQGLETMSTASSQHCAKRYSGICNRGLSERGCAMSSISDHEL